MLWLLVLPMLFLLPYLGQYIYLPGSSYTDLLVSHIPNALFLKQSLATWGSVPLWSDNILGGYPFIANPLSGIWYPPGWLAILLPIPFGFNLMMILHLIWGGLGMYLFLRSESVSPTAAILGGILFEAMPKAIAHIAAGHVTLIYAIAWTPWLLFAIKRATHSHKFATILFPGIILSLILLADIRWAAYSGVLWVIYSLKESFANFTVVRAAESNASLQLGLKRCKHWLFRIIPQISLAGLLTAPFLLPFLEYLHLSTRSSLSTNDSLTLSLPASRLIGLLYPSFGDSAEWTIYAGGMSLALFLLALFTPRLRVSMMFWIGVVIVSLILALGSAIPGMTTLVGLPFIDLLRVPPRWIFMAGFGLAVISARVVDDLTFDLPIDRLTKKISPEIVPAALLFFVLLLTGGIAWLTHALPLNFIWGAVSVGCACIFLILRLRSVLPSMLFQGLTFALILLDLIGVNWLSIAPAKAQIWPDGQQALANYLKSQNDYFRVYSPSYSLPQDLAAQFNLQLADGVDPMQIKAYRDYMVKATGINNSGYSVTLPPYKSGDPSTDNQAESPNAELLGRLNVSFIAAQYPLAADGLRLLGIFDSSYLYRNSYSYPRAWVAPKPGIIRSDITTARIIIYEPNQITVQANGPGELILSEIAYPGWQAWIDGNLTEPKLADGLFRRVTLPPGQHFVEYHYYPTQLSLGLGFAAAGLIMVLGSLVFQKR